MKTKHQLGFTLVELLIATIILFSSLAAVSLIYRGAFIASEKASNHVKMVANLPALITQIQQQIKLSTSAREQRVVPLAMETIWDEREFVHL